MQLRARVSKKTAKGGAMATSGMEERLGRFWIFEGFSPEEYTEIARIVEEQTFPSNVRLFKQGDQADFFYLVESGTVEEVGTDPFGKVILRRRADAGGFFGHRSLMVDSPRQTTATVKREGQLLAINADDFKALLAAVPVLRERLRRTREVNRLLATPLFRAFSQEQLFLAADLAQVVDYPAGQVIFRQGEPADDFYVVDHGQVKEHVTGSTAGGRDWPQYYTAGSFFGVRDLMNKAPRRATAEAITDVRLLRFSASAFDSLCVLQPKFKDALDPPSVLDYLRQIQVFAQLSKEELKHLAGFVGLAHYPAGEALYHQGEVDPTLYYLLAGEAVIRSRDEKGRDRPSGYLRAGHAVGQTSLFTQEPRDATVVPVVDCDWLYLTRQDLEQFLKQHPDVENRLIRKKEVKERQRLSRFPWMDADERFLLRERRHWFFAANRLVPPSLLLLLALVLFALRVNNAFVILILILAVPWMLWRVVDWANDYYIVTTKRVAHREKVLAIRERRDETPLDKVQNVNIDRGFFGNIFGFGTLIIDTAAAAGVTRVTFDYLPGPENVQGLIFEQMSRLRAGERSETRQIIRDKLEQSIGVSIRPVVPRPAIPVAKDPAPMQPIPQTSGVLAQLYDFLWGRRFWIEQRTEDQITWRKHWIRLLRIIWMPALAIIFLLLILAFLLTQTQSPAVVIAALAVPLIAALFWFWWSWVNWGNDLYTVTDDRIIDTEALPWGFRTRRAETTFDRIQNVSFDIPNPVATLLNYGTVLIYTAGVEGRLDFEYVRDPKRVQAEIFRRLTAYEARQRRQERERRWEELPEWFSTYEEMHRP
jgi:CRP-like cAMP-binding protein/membrane protein YdbS with pleckstrin-like domain